MRNLYLIFAALLPCTAVFAQQRYVPATVYLPAGDSLTGEMDYRKWDVDPASVNFRRNGAVTSFTPETLTGFRIHENDERYSSLAGDVDVTPETVEYLSADKTRLIENGNHFFRLVLGGPAELLMHTDKQRRQHFAVRNSDTVIHLIRKVEYVHDPESSHYGKLRTLNHFRQQLDMLLTDCDQKINFEMLEYRVASLSSALVKYAACKQPGVAVTAPKKDPQMRAMFGVLAGASLNMYKGTGTHIMVWRNKLNSSSASPLIGVFMDAPISRRRQQFSLNFELVYDNLKLKNSNPDKIDVNFHYLNLQTLFRYTYPVGELRPYVNGGMGIMTKLGKGKDEWVFEEFQMRESALGGGRNVTLPLIAGAGLRYKRVNGEFRMILPHILDNYSTMNVTATTLQLLVRYTLFP